MENPKDKGIERPPVVVVMGHIDHGKSTLLDYIRSSNTTSGEAGGITQHISAYEIEHTAEDGSLKKITFLDTPGHEAFSRMRSRGASVADIAILVVSTEDTVMPQTLEALNAIRENKLPFIVAMNKVDSPKANIEKTKQVLAEHDILIEEYGGQVPAIPTSAKTGQGIPELLSMILLVAELEELKADPSLPGEGVVIEAHREGNRGISATIIIKDGTYTQGSFVAAQGAFSPIRIMENFKGEKISSATFSSPVNIVGWSVIPEVGSICKNFKSKKDAEKYIEEAATLQEKTHVEKSTATTIIPLIIKTEVSGTVDAIIHEIQKINNERTQFSVIFSGSGPVSEADMKRASSKDGSVIVGFGTTIDQQANALKERYNTEVATFNIIYEAAQWLEEIRDKRTTSITVEEVRGTAKVLKVFNKNKNQQVLGCRMEEGSIERKAHLNVVRRGEVVGKAHIKELQKSKSQTDSVFEGDEFGIAIESRVEIVPGDQLQSFISVEK